MKKDIKTPTVNNVGVAVVREMNENDEPVFNVYLVNLKNENLEACLVSSKGYGRNVKTDEETKTSTLRHFLEIVPAQSFAKIEPIIESVFGLTNEYWVSFWIGNQMYDKKYIFLAESINDKNFIEIPLIHKKGVFIK